MRGEEWESGVRGGRGMGRRVEGIGGGVGKGGREEVESGDAKRCGKPLMYAYLKLPVINGTG